MGAYFELWDLASGNCAGDFDREEDALALLASVLTKEGPQSVADYGLAERTDTDVEKPACSGEELVEKVRLFQANVSARSSLVTDIDVP